MANFLRKGFSGLFVGWLTRLRFPYLFLLSCVLFVINLVIPDVIPFIDEILMGLATVLLGKLRKKPAATKPAPEKE